MIDLWYPEQRWIATGKSFLFISLIIQAKQIGKTVGKLSENIKEKPGTLERNPVFQEKREKR